MRRGRVARFLLAFAAFVFLAASCGPLPAIEGPGEPTKRVLNLAMPEPLSIDPGLASGAGTLTIVNLLFEPLTRISRDGSVVPAAAESWEISGDGRTFYFQLRSNARWQSDRRLTSRDFRNGWTRNLDPAVASDYSYLLYTILGAQEYAEGLAEDASNVAITSATADELQVVLKSPSTSFLARVATQSFMPLPRDEITDWGNRWTEAAHIDTNGPYRLVEWFHSEGMRLVPNPHYWDPSRQRFDEIRVKLVADDEPLIPIFRNQVADVIELRRRELQAVREGEDLRSLTAVFGLGGNWFLVYNTNKEPWDDVRVRRAFSLAIDRADLIPKVFTGSEQPAGGLLPAPLIRGEIRPHPPPDRAIQEARQLLSDAGYPDGQGFPAVQLSYHRTAQWERLSSLLVARWAEVLGVDVGHNVMEWREYLDFHGIAGRFRLLPRGLELRVSRSGKLAQHAMVVGG